MEFRTSLDSFIYFPKSIDPESEASFERVFCSVQDSSLLKQQILERWKVIRNAIESSSAG